MKHGFPRWIDVVVRLPARFRRRNGSQQIREFDCDRIRHFAFNAVADGVERGALRRQCPREAARVG